MEKQKQSLYFPEDTLREITREALRLDRSLSWTVQQAWRLAREEVRKFPGSRFAGQAERQSTASASPRPPPLSAEGAREAEASAQVREFLKGKFDRELTG
jgi:uncharacterized small protein (TIGR04563 family)